MIELIQSSCLAVLVLLSLGSLLNLSNHPHWFIRGWDFPRLQIVALGSSVAIIYLATQFYRSGVLDGSPFWTTGTIATAAMMVCLGCWHGYRIMPYTRLWKKQTVASRATKPTNSLRLIISNVQQENEQHECWMSTLDREKPDVVLALEIDQRWADEIEDWRKQFPHEIIVPQDNYYGMLLVSRHPIVESEIRFIVQNDIPSIDAKIAIDSDTTLRFVGVHPRPPEPIRDVDSTARDAEMMIWADELRHDRGPLVIGGDLNDVAWSRTTRLFLRISDLLDPRRGRGMINSFHARHWFLRFPLDHVFHSQHFTLGELKRLPKVGSDHYPILIELHFNPEMKSATQPLPATEQDYRSADTLIDRGTAMGANQ